MERRPNPDELLRKIQAEESVRGRLKLFFGANPGVGKTYAMLEAAQQRRREGVDLLAGVVETHGRKETAALLEGIEVLPRRKLDYKGVALEEFDLEGALARKPRLILVDELAHTNAPGSRHAKRWQDVQELLDAGIDVYTTLNVQHWESLNDVVAQITGVQVHETVPDTFLEQSHDIELVDLSPEDLLGRLKAGKVYLGAQAEQALQHFFKPGNLAALRELALRHTAERVDLQVQAYKSESAVDEVWPVAERLLVGVTASPMSAKLVRAAQRLASRLRGEWIALYVETPGSAQLPAAERERLLETLRLAEELGAETVTLTGDDVARRMVEYARSRNVSKIIVGKPRWPLWRERLFGSVVERIAHISGDIDLYVISGLGGEGGARVRVREARRDWRPWAWAAGVVAAATLVCWPLFHRADWANLIIIYLLGVTWVAYRHGGASAWAAAVLSVLCFDFFFVPPYFSFTVNEPRHVVTFGVMLAAGVVIGTLTGRLRRLNSAAFEREAHTWALYRLSRMLSETPEPKEMTLKAWRHLKEFYRVPVLVLRVDAGGGLGTAAGDPTAFGFDEKEEAVAKWVLDRGQEAGAGTATLAGARGLYLPLRGLQGLVGVLAVRPGPSVSAEDPEQLHLLQAFASEIGAALASTELSEAAGRAEAQVESERLRNVVLSSFSIDVNEPLAEIGRLTREVLERGQEPSEPLRRALREIQDKAARLAAAARELPRLIERRSAQAGAPEPAVGPARAVSAGKPRLGDFLSTGGILIAAERPTKDELLKALIGALGVADAQRALELVLEREKSSSTVIGSGLAIPHARVPGLDAIKVAFGVAPAGLRSRSAAERSIKLVILFLSPAEAFREHLAFLGAVTGLFRGGGLAQALVASASPEELIEKVRRAEEGR